MFVKFLMFFTPFIFVLYKIYILSLNERKSNTFQNILQCYFIGNYFFTIPCYLRSLKQVEASCQRWKQIWNLFSNNVCSAIYSQIY